MEKSYLKRPLATLLSLLMVIGLFTVCGFGVLADDQTVDITLKTWSVDELDAAAQATGTRNYVDSPIYHKTDYIIGSKRVDTSANGAWLFHSQGLTTNPALEQIKKGDTLRVVAYLNGELNNSAAWGYLEVAYDNNGDLTHHVDFTPDVIAQMEDTIILGEKVKKFTMDIELDDDRYSEKGKLMQSRVWVNGGATLACYGVEFINLTTNQVLWGLEPSKSKEGGDAVNTFITVPVLASYTSRPEVFGNVPEENRKYTAQDFSEACTGENNDNVNAVLFKGLTQTLTAGSYAVDLDFATKYGLGEKKFTFNVYAGEEKIFDYTVRHTADIVSARHWSPDSGIGRQFRFEFDISEENSGKEITFEIVCHNQTDFILRDMSLSRQISAGDTLAQWDYKDLLAETDRSQMGVTSYAEDEQKVIGTEIYEGTGLWACENILTPNEVTIQKGHQLRVVHKLYALNGNLDGSPYFRVFTEGGAAVVDYGGSWGSYRTDATKYDPVYGYAYKELTYEFAVNDELFSGEATSISVKLMNWLMIAGHDYGKGPVRWYESSVYDVTDGTLLYTLDGETINNSQAGGDAKRRAVYGSEHQAEVPVGYRAISPDPNGLQCWSRFNVMSSVGETPVEPDDELEAVVDIWVDNGYDATELKYGFELFSGEGQQLDSGIRLSDDAYNALPTLIHPEYGYSYKRVVCNYTITEATGERINQHGLYPLIGTDAVTNMQYDKHPLSIYRYYVYNKTKNVYYADFTGDELILLGGSGTGNEVIWATKADSAYANDGYVRAGQSITFDALTTTAGAAGQYAMNFAVTGEQGAEYTLTAYSIDGESVKPVGAKTFTATGSAQDVSVAFNVRQSLVGKDITFGIAAKDADLDVTKVSFQYVGALAAEYTWGVADIAAKSLDEDMTYEFTNKTIVGANVKDTPWEIFFAGSCWTGAIPNVAAGDTLRFELDMGTDLAVTNLEGVMATLKLQNDHAGWTDDAPSSVYSGAQYNALELKADSDYGFEYRTLTHTLTLPDDNETLISEITTGSGFNVIAQPCQIANVGRNVYRAAIYNDETGELLWEISGDQIRPNLYETAQEDDIIVTDGYYEKVVGLEVNGDSNFPASNGLWATMDIPVEGVTFAEGHTIRFVQKMNIVDDKLTGGGPFFRVYHNATKIADQSLGWDIYKEAETQVDPDYGYVYREIPYEVTITAEQACSNAHITHWMTTPGADYNTSVHQFYEFAAYDVTDGANDLLYTISGSTIAKANKSSHIESEPIVVPVINPEKASAVIFSEGASGAVTEPITVTFADLGLGAGVYSFNVQGDESVAAAAMIQLGEYGDTYTIGAGEFVVTEDILDAPIGFVLNKQAGAAASVSGVELMFVRELAEDDTQNYEEELNKINQAAADPVIDKIEALPEPITLNDKAAVQEARAAYDALTPSQKALVSNYEILTNAEETIKDLEDLPADVAAVIEKIDALPAADDVTLDNEAAVKEAQDAFNALSDENKDLVSNSDKLSAVGAKIDTLKAQAVEDLINALPETITQEHKADVENARSAYDALTDAQKALVSEDAVAKLEAAEKALAITYGDVNGDGKINAEDALLCLQHSVKLTTLEGDQFTAADVDESGKIDASDALYILQYSVKLVTELPIK